jgi:hypothetical protein
MIIETETAPNIQYLTQGIKRKHMRGKENITRYAKHREELENLTDALRRGYFYLLPAYIQKYKA